MRFYGEFHWGRGEEGEEGVGVKSEGKVELGSQCWWEVEGVEGGGWRGGPWGAQQILQTVALSWIVWSSFSSRLEDTGSHHSPEGGGGGEGGSVSGGREEEEGEGWKEVSQPCAQPAWGCGGLCSLLSVLR